MWAFHASPEGRGTLAVSRLAAVFKSSSNPSPALLAQKACAAWRTLQKAWPSARLPDRVLPKKSAVALTHAEPWFMTTTLSVQ